AGILENVHRLDVGGIDIRYSATKNDAVDHNQGSRTSTQGTLPPNQNGRLLTSLVELPDLDARHGSLQGLKNIDVGGPPEGIQIYRGNGAGEVTLLLTPVTHYHHFIERTIISFQGNVYYRFIRNSSFLRFIPYKGNHQDSILLGH